MPSPHLVPQEVWTEVTRRLITFFRYNGIGRPDDEVQEVFVRMLADGECDIPDANDPASVTKVAKGYARFIVMEYRRQFRRQGLPLEEIEGLSALPAHSAGSARSAEQRIYAKQIVRLAMDKLRPQDIALLRKAIQKNDDEKKTARERGRFAVALFRVRQKIRSVIPDE